MDGLRYLRKSFDALFVRIGIDLRSLPTLLEHHQSFFESSQERIDRLRAEGAEFIGDIATFRRVFENRSGITVSTIHGVKGAEYDTVIAYALLEGMVPHYSDPDGQDSAKRLLYVISSRARKNLHLISERGRLSAKGQEYSTTVRLAECSFLYDEIPYWQRHTATVSTRDPLQGLRQEASAGISSREADAARSGRGSGGCGHIAAQARWRRV